MSHSKEEQRTFSLLCHKVSASCSQAVRERGCTYQYKQPLLRRSLVSGAYSEQDVTRLTCSGPALRSLWRSFSCVYEHFALCEWQRRASCMYNNPQVRYTARRRSCVPEASGFDDESIYTRRASHVQPKWKVAAVGLSLKHDRACGEGRPQLGSGHLRRRTRTCCAVQRSAVQRSRRPQPRAGLHVTRPFCCWLLLQ